GPTPGVERQLLEPCQTAYGLRIAGVSGHGFSRKALVGHYAVGRFAFRFGCWAPAAHDATGGQLPRIYPGVGCQRRERPDRLVTDWRKRRGARGRSAEPGPGRHRQWGGLAEPSCAPQYGRVGNDLALRET